MAKIVSLFALVVIIAVAAATNAAAANAKTPVRAPSTPATSPATSTSIPEAILQIGKYSTDLDNDMLVYIIDQLYPSANFTALLEKFYPDPELRQQHIKESVDQYNKILGAASKIIRMSEIILKKFIREVMVVRKINTLPMVQQPKQ